MTRRIYNDAQMATELHKVGDHTFCYFPTHKTRSPASGVMGYYDGGHAQWCIKAGTVDR